MKVSKVFGCVLGLHFGVIAVLLIQPGCQSSQPPTQTFTQERTARSPITSAVAPTSGTSSRNTLASTNATQQRIRMDGPTIQNSVQGARRASEGFIPATRQGEGTGQGLDAAFNAGFEDGTDGEFGEFSDIAPIAPLTSNNRTSGGQTVDIAGASTEVYTVKKGDNLWSIAKRYNVSLNELYAANGLNKDSVLRIGQQIEIPVEGSSATVRTVTADAYQPTSFNQETTNYTVKRGDSLSKIANQFDTSVRALKAANGKTSDLSRVGETLLIPVSSTGSATRSGASSANSSTSGLSATSTTTTTTTRTSSATATSTGTRTHTVRAGEFPATIARQYGMTTGELLALNGITDPRKLQVGQVLQVSGSGSASNVASRTETVVSPASATVAPRTAPTPTRTPASNNTAPVQIRVIEADPLIEGEATEIQGDDLFEGAVEIPVIRLEE
jgi:LysM repeat protein